MSTTPETPPTLNLTRQMVRGQYGAITADNIADALHHVSNTWLTVAVKSAGNADRFHALRGCAEYVTAIALEYEAQRAADAQAEADDWASRQIPGQLTIEDGMSDG